VKSRIVSIVLIDTKHNWQGELFKVSDCRATVLAGRALGRTWYDARGKGMRDRGNRAS